MHSRIIFVVCSIAVLLLMVSSSVVIADDQHNHRARKPSSGAWPAHQFQPLGKRGRFVFRDAPNAHHYDPVNDDLFINDDAQDADSNVDKRNWRL